MPIFKCPECGCVENTACCNYWYRVYAKKLPPLCSLCDPDLGKWHGHFPRTQMEEHGYVELEDGFWGPPDGSWGKPKKGAAGDTNTELKA